MQSTTTGSDLTLAGKSTEILPSQVADSDSKEETQPAIAPVESSSSYCRVR